MTEKSPKNKAASIRQRLLNLSREKKEDFAYLLTRFVNERFLYRLSLSRYADSFILKGAFLFFLWTNATYRPTKDVDLLSLDERGIKDIEQIFKEICEIRLDDGLEFSKDSVRAEAIREAQSYGGIRAYVEGKLTTARIRIQFDIGFGDAVTPDPTVEEMPAILNLPGPRVKIYPKETLIAEKYEAIVKLGMINSRMKDFYDVWYLSKTSPFDGDKLSEALRNTFRRRRTALPEIMPIAFTEEFCEDKDKRVQWNSFIASKGMRHRKVDLKEIIAGLKLFLVPPTEALTQKKPFTMKWEPEKGWE